MSDGRHDCDSDRLRRFLEEASDEADRAAVAAHLDGCESCRERLEAMAADGPWWAEVRRHAPGRDADEAGVPEFLDPPDAEGSIGRFGAYRVLEVVGRGGMGVVLKAFDPALHRVVAIKVMAPQLAAGAAARQRFTREARAAASVVHEHVVTIHAVDEWKGLPYLVMSYVGGRSLQERLERSGVLGPAEIVRVGMQIAAGLAAAHAQGLVHRDIKPSNILLENGVERVKITDFGLARSADDASLTHLGHVIGTPQYMSPEQARGEPMDQRADLFSLGCVMYAMAAGRSPFRAETTLAVLRRVCEDRPRPLRDLNPEVPDWLERDRDEAAGEGAGRTVRVGRGGGGAAGTLPGPPAAAEAEPAARAAWAAGRPAGGRWVAVGSSRPHWSRSWPHSGPGHRLQTLEGTLVVEVNDPAASVQIDGQDVVITGMGPRDPAPPEPAPRDRGRRRRGDCRGPTGRRGRSSISAGSPRPRRATPRGLSRPPGCRSPRR